MLPAILDEVAEGHEVVLSRHGREVAVIVRPDSLRSRRAGAASLQAEELRSQLEEARERPLPRRPGIQQAWADELVDEIRSSRTHR
jgi:antitoxin (DNA-binding transcriptional repressor) of toxin-antitoxin stability system